jgi:hypothetical protein
MKNTQFESFRILKSLAPRFLLVVTLGSLLVFPVLSSAQVTVTVEPAGRVTWDEMAASKALEALSPEPERHLVLPFMPTPAAQDIGPSPEAPSSPAEPLDFEENPPTPQDPDIMTGSSFEGLPDNNTSIPPDTMGAAGPNHLMIMLNTQVRIQDKGGTNIDTVSLDTFWTNGTGLSGDPFDPRLIYDSLSGRWMATVDANSRSTSSEVWFAISDTSDPTGGWTFYGFDADPANTYWSDFPDIGTNATWVAITNNMFTVVGNSFGGAKMWVIDKSTALSGGALTTTVFGVGFDGSFYGASLRPALTFDAGETTLYIADGGTWSSGGVPALRLSMITGTGPAPVWAVVPGGFNGLFLVDTPYELIQIDADQLGTTTDVETNDPRLLNAVFRNGRLWTTHSGGMPFDGSQSAPPSADRTAVFWYELDPAAMPSPIVQSGVIENGAGTHYFFPSIAVNANNDAVVGFSYSDATQYVEAAFTGRLSTDPAGTMEAVTTCKAGEDSYVKTFSGTRNRWGDYSATVVDPADDLTFWTLQEYAETEVGGWDRWGTWWCLVFWSPTAVDLISFTAKRDADKVELKWQTGFEVDNLGFHLYRDVGGERIRLTPELLAGSALMVGAGTALTAGRSYTWRDVLPPDIRDIDVQYWLEDIDLDGTRSWHGPIDIEAGRSGDQGLFSEVTTAQILSRLGRTAGKENAAKTVSQVRSHTGETTETFLALGTQLFLAGQEAVKILVKEEGWYQVGQPELMAAGLSPSVNPKRLQLFADGVQQSIVVTGQEDGRFDPRDDVQFYGTGLDTPWTDTKVYWLVEGLWGGQRVRMRRGGGHKLGETSFPMTIERKDRTVHFSALKNGDESNFFGPVVSTAPVAQDLYLQHLDTNPPQPARLELVLQGVTAGLHQIVVQMNGIDVGEMAFEGQTSESADFFFPQAEPWLQAGTNSVTLVAMGEESDVSLVDVIRLTYWHTYTAESDSLRFTAQGQHRVRVDGFSNRQIQVVDITDPSNPARVKTAVKPKRSGFSVDVMIPGRGERTLLAFGESCIKQAAGGVLNEPSNWLWGNQGAEFLIISHEAFLEGLAPLKSLREKEGRSVALIKLGDVYDECSYGVKTPWAIRSFIKRARNWWDSPPLFVLFVGDASFDPRNYLGLGDFDLLPTQMVDTEFMETASDDWFVDLDEDEFPDLSVGRLPVRTPEEISTVVSKITGRVLHSGGAWHDALMVADRNDGFDFEGVSLDLEGFLPEGMPVIEIFRDKTPNARDELLTSLNDGPSIVNYMGHGSSDIWRGGLLTSDDASFLTNGARLPFVLSMTCLNGLFHDLYTESLAEALLKAPKGGAFAVWTSSGLTYPAGQATLNREMLRLLFNGESPTIGEAAMTAKAAVVDPDVRKTWMLFGDPTATLE